MKKFLNVSVFIIIVGLAGSWDCGCIDFCTFIACTCLAISVLPTLHIIGNAISLLLCHKIRRRETA